MRFSVEGLGLKVEGLEFRAQDLRDSVLAIYTDPNSYTLTPFNPYITPQTLKPLSSEPQILNPNP